MKSRPAGDLAAPGLKQAPLVAERTVLMTDSPDIPFALRQQRNLFTRGGRLDLVDLLTSGSQVVRPTGRTARAPTWAVQLRAARAENEMERG